MKIETKTVEQWIKGLPSGRLKDRLWDALIDRLYAKMGSVEEVVNLAYLMRAYLEDCPYFFGAALFFEGLTPPSAAPSIELDGYNDAKEAMKPSEG